MTIKLSWTTKDDDYENLCHRVHHHYVPESLIEEVKNVASLSVLS